MANYALSGEADADILNIARASLAEWGIDRAGVYILGLHDAFQSPFENVLWRVVWCGFSSTEAERPFEAVSIGAQKCRARRPPERVFKRALSAWPIFQASAVTRATCEKAIFGSNRKVI